MEQKSKSQMISEQETRKRLNDATPEEWTESATQIRDERTQNDTTVIQSDTLTPAQRAMLERQCFECG